MSLVDEAKAAVRSGKHRGWKMLVRTMFALGIEFACLIVAYRDEKNWYYALVPVNTDNVYDQIAGYYSETLFIPPAAKAQLSGSLQVVASGKPQKEVAVTMFPMGLAFAGKDMNGKWRDDVVLVDGHNLSVLLGQPMETVAAELKPLLLRWAMEEIWPLAGWLDDFEVVDSGKTN